MEVTRLQGRSNEIWCRKLYVRAAAGGGTMLSVQDDAKMATGFLGPQFTAEFGSWVPEPALNVM